MDADQQEREWTVSVNGAGLRVQEIGDGAQTVVFSPALFANRRMFDAPVAALSDDFRCIRYDHRGQGDSGVGAHQEARHRLGTEGLYEDAVALLDELHLASCHWVGASIGGFVGMRLAARHPDRVRSLVLIGPNVRPLPRADLRQIDLLGSMLRASHRLGRVGAAVQRRTTERVMRNMLGATFMSDPSREDLREAWRQRYSAQLIPEAVPMIREVFGYPENQRDMLARIQAPTLILVGDNDAHGIAAPDEGARETQQAISGARLVTIHGAGHIVLVEEPAAATAEIANFIRGAEAV